VPTSAKDLRVETKLETFWITEQLFELILQNELGFRKQFCFLCLLRGHAN
jgi:hypothetical protein